MPSLGYSYKRHYSSSTANLTLRVIFNTAVATWQTCSNDASSSGLKSCVIEESSVHEHDSTNPGAHDLRTAFISLSRRRRQFPAENKVYAFER